MCGAQVFISTFLNVHSWHVMKRALNQFNRLCSLSLGASFRLVLLRCRRTSLGLQGKQTFLWQLLVWHSLLPTYYWWARRKVSRRYFWSFFSSSDIFFLSFDFSCSSRGCRRACCSVRRACWSEKVLVRWWFLPNFKDKLAELVREDRQTEHTDDKSTSVEIPHFFRRWNYLGRFSIAYVLQEGGQEGGDGTIIVKSKPNHCRYTK